MRKIWNGQNGRVDDQTLVIYMGLVNLEKNPESFAGSRSGGHYAGGFD